MKAFEKPKFCLDIRLSVVIAIFDPAPQFQCWRGAMEWPPASVQNMSAHLRNYFHEKPTTIKATKYESNIEIRGAGDWRYKTHSASWPS